MLEVSVSIFPQTFSCNQIQETFNFPVAGAPPPYMQQQSTASYQSQNLPSGSSPLASKASTGSMSSHSNSTNSISSSNRTSRVFQDNSNKFSELSLDESQSPPPPPIPRYLSLISQNFGKTFKFWIGIYIVNHLLSRYRVFQFIENSFLSFLPR